MIGEYWKLLDTWQRMAWAAPQVIAARTLRSYAPDSARDQAELMRMVTEKQAAVFESWMSLAFSTPWVAQKMAKDFWWAGASNPGSAGQATAKAALKAGQHALRPFERRATANARRLRSRSKP